MEGARPGHYRYPGIVLGCRFQLKSGRTSAPRLQQAWQTNRSPRSGFVSEKYTAGLEMLCPAGACFKGLTAFGSSLMTKTDSELSRFLSQRAFGSLHSLRNLRYWCSCLRMLFQQFDIRRSVRFACWSLLFCFNHFEFPHYRRIDFAPAVLARSNPA
jgi:hypothetical protein